MRILFTTQPFLGHFRPLVPLAAALRNRGHQVLFASLAEFSREITFYGFEVHPLEAPAAGYPSMASTREAEIEALAGRHQEAAALELWALARAWSPQLIVRDGGEFAGFVIAERCGIPHVSAGWVEFDCLRVRDPDLMRRIESMRAAVGLAREFSWGDLYRYVHIESMPPSFFTRRGSPCANAAFIRQENTVGPFEKACGWYKDLPYTESILISFGTVATSSKESLRLCYALRNTPINVLCAGGSEWRRIAAFVRGSKNVVVHRSMPQSWLLSRISVLVNHGSQVSVKEAIRESVPLLLAPQWNEQFYVAARCIDLGIAHRLGGGIHSSDIRDTVMSLMADADVHRRLEQIHAEMLSLPNIDWAADYLERIG